MLNSIGAKSNLFRSMETPGNSNIRMINEIQHDYTNEKYEVTLSILFSKCLR